MDSVDWAMNAAQINRDIRLANEHLPPGMQVFPLSASSFRSNSSMLHQYSPDEPPRWRRILVAMQHGRCNTNSRTCVAHVAGEPNRAASVRAAVRLLAGARPGQPAQRQRARQRPLCSDVWQPVSLRLPFSAPSNGNLLMLCRLLLAPAYWECLCQ
jgi:hypothetical protein